MRAAYLVIYEGRPEDPDEFLRYYVEHHVPIIWTWPRIRGVELQLGAPSGDRVVSVGEIFMIARFCFANLADLRAALASEGREQARADRRNFPPFSGTVTHQAVELREVAR